MMVMLEGGYWGVASGNSKVVGGNGGDSRLSAP